MRLDGKVALITGATGGVGAATAHRLAREGARLILHELGERAREELAARLGTEVAVARAADVSSARSTTG
ncbi:MAG: SDR family NAD(P)-dependent oxidoreductase [Deltaproteobacteria bacterium]|nr:SDR family NAD(P)-dependent oxidoreductase [Deltaproteobacteria bacterium]